VFMDQGLVNRLESRPTEADVVITKDAELMEIAAQRGHLAVTEEEVDQFIERIARERGATPQQVYDSLAGEGITRSEYRSYMEAEVLQLKVLQARVRGRINITENDLQEEYRRFVREASTRSILHPAHVFIGVPPDASSEQLVALRQRAEDVARRARAGEDFAQLVQAYSDDEGTRATAGDLGDVNPGTLPEAIERQLNALADGDVADPIQGPNGYHVFRMISRRPITPPPFAEVRDRLYASLLNREMVRQQRIYLRELRRGAQHGARANVATNGGKTPYSWITKTATLFVTPVFYLYVDQFSRWLAARSGRTEGDAGQGVSP